MSLLRTAQSTDNGVMRLTSYQRSRRDGTDLHHGPANAAHVDRLVDLSSRSSQQHLSEVTGSSGIYTNSTTTDEELHNIIGHSHLLDGSTRASSNESRDPMDDSFLYQGGSSSRGRSSTGTGDSSFSMSRVYNNYSVTPSRHRFSTPPPARRQTPPTLRSPSKSFDSTGKKKISLNDPMSFQSMMVGKVQVQNSAPSSPASRRSPLSPRQSLSPARQRGPAAMSFEKVDPQGRTIPSSSSSQPKSEAYERASKLLKKVDASKQAALKVEKAREAARQAMDKAKRARAAKLQAESSASGSGTTPSSSQGTKKKLRFSDELEEKPRGDVHDVEEITIPSTNVDPSRRKRKDDDKFLDIPMLSDDDSTSTVQDRYGVDESNGNRYEVVNAEEDVIDDVLDLEASKKRRKERMPPLSPTRNSGDDLNDMMDFAESILLGGMGQVSTNDDTHAELNKEVKECITDACSFTDELGCGSDVDKVDDTKVMVAATNKPMSPTKRYPMPQNPAVLERVLEDQGIQGTPPPSPPPEVMDSVAYRVQKNAMSNGNAIHDQTAREDDASHGDELDDIMNFAAGLLGSKSVAQSTPARESPTKSKKIKEKSSPIKSKSKSPTKIRQEPPAPAIPDNLGEGDELDDIMDFAAGLLGSKQPAPPPPPRKNSPPETINASSIVEPIQTSQAVPNSHPNKVDERSCLVDACSSVWGEEFFRKQEEEVVIDAAGNKVVKGSEEEAARPSLLHVATKNDGHPVPPPPEAFNLKPVPSERTPTSLKAVPTLADDLTDKSNPSSNLDLPDYLEQYEAEMSTPFVPIVTTVDEEDKPPRRTDASESNLPLHPEPVHPEPIHPEPTHSEPTPSALASEKPSKAGTILDSNDEYWDTLSTIASLSKDQSLNRAPNPHVTNTITEDKPVTLDTLAEGAPFSAILCSWLGMEQQNGGLKRPNPIGPTDTFGETNGDTFISTEASLLPKIPSMIEYHVTPEKEEEKDDPPTTAVLNTVETLITKRSSDSSDSTESFYLQKESNPFADDAEQDLDKAIIRGQKMASPISPTTSRYGDDKGDEPLGSPSYLSHASNGSHVTPSSRKVTDRKKPWDKDANSSPAGIFHPGNQKDRVALATEDSELAAMLGIKKVVSQDKDKVKEDPKEERPYGFVSGSNSQDSSLDDLLMVLTRSAGDDEDVIENLPSTLDTSSPKKSSIASPRTERSVKSPESEHIEDIITSLKRAETMGHDEDSVEMVSSPQSARRKGFKPEGKISTDFPKRKESESQIVEKDASCAVMDILFTDGGNTVPNSSSQSNNVQQKQEKAKSRPPSSPKKQDSIKQAVSDLLLQDTSPGQGESTPPPRQETAMATPPSSPKKNQGTKTKSPRRSGEDKSKKEDAKLQQTFVPTSPKAANAQSSDSARKQSTWAEQNDAANAAAARELELQTKIDAQARRNEGTSIIDAFFDGGAPSPTRSAQHASDQYDSRKPSIPEDQQQQDSPKPSSRPKEYLSPSKSDEDDLQVMQSPTDLAVRMSPVKELRVTAAAAKKADDISSVSSRQSLESKTKVMTDLLSKYDKIIDQLVHEKSVSNNAGTSAKATDVETTITELREQRVYAEALERSKKSSRKLSPRKTDEQFASHAIGKKDPSPRLSASPTRSPRRSTQHQQQLRPLVTKSPTRSPRRPSQLEMASSRTHITSARASVTPTRTERYSSPSRASPSRVSATRIDESLSGSRIHRELSSRRTAMSPTRSPRRTRSTAMVQSRDQTTPIRSDERQDRASAPRRSKSLSRSRSRPRPEDKIEEMRRRRAESLSPKKRRGDPYGRRGSSELNGGGHGSRGRSDLHGDPYGRRGSDLRRDSPTRATVRAVKRVYSPERRLRSRSYDLGNSSSSSGSEESEYGRRSREIHRELRSCKRASDNIQHTHDELFDELGIFQDKLLRHSRRKDHEREFIAESRNAVNDFQHRLERVREDAHATARSGRETPDTLDQVEHALEEAWGDFDNVRGTMLNNLRQLNDAKEELMRERLHREEENDDEQLHMLENMIQEIRQSHHVRDSRSFRRNDPSQYRSKYVPTSSGRAGRSRSAPTRDRVGYPLGYSTSIRDRTPYTSTLIDRTSRSGYSPSNRSTQYSRRPRTSEGYSSYR